jgi:hypothetical protein
MQASESSSAMGDNSLTAAVRQAFAEHADPRAPSLGRCLEEMVPFLAIDLRASELVIDKRALLLGSVSAGQQGNRRGVGLNSAIWLYDWLVRKTAFKEIALGTGDDTDSLFARGLPVVLSRTLRSFLLPRAHKLADATVQRSLVDLRHILFALTEQPGAEWEEVIPGGLTPDLALDLRRYLVEQIAANPEPKENVAFWRSLVPGSTIDEKPKPVTPPPPGLAPTPEAPKAAEAPEAPEVPEAPESLRTLADQPARVDSLGRQSFARVLAERLRDANTESAGLADAGAFMAHIHGPWGFGKSSVLNFLADELQRPPEGPAWLVVEFNAWKHQRLRPPWWSLISAVYDAALKAPNVSGNFRLRRIWWAWRLRADWLPILLVAAVLGLLAFGVVRALGSGDAAIKVLTAVLTAAAGVYAYVRFLLFGSAKAAEAYSEIKTDPYQPVVRLYGKLIKAVGRPVAIFIDDLDRCDSAYVVELIEGIQTLLRTESVTYVVAADRKWICAAFERKYGDFSGQIGEPGRPLGYLFLDKLFQISAALPALSGDARIGYWKTLLDGAPQAPAGALSTADAEAQVKGKTSIEALQAVIDEAPEEHQPALRAAAAVEITRADSAQAVEHRLQHFSALLEPNPRAMKRLVNAVGMAQARCFLEARTVSLDALARWTLIELRWPLLADYLADNVDAIEMVRATDEARKAAILPAIAAGLVADRQVRAIVAPDGEAGLDATILAAMLR